jgi:hydrogenase maturation protease
VSTPGWDALEGRAPRAVAIGGILVGRGSLVRLHPRGRRRGDVFDLALDGRTAVVESLHEELDGAVQLAVVLEDDPGRDLGIARQPGHRFFFSADEVEPLGAGLAPGAPQVLVAGIGNVLLADDGFGVEVARLLAQRELPAGVKVEDFGIRGMDLAYELQDDWDAAVLVDAVPRGEAPGTLYVIEPQLDAEEGPQAVPDAHGMDPVRVLALARVLGTLPARVLVVGCEPDVILAPDDERIVMELSPTARAAASAAVELVESLIGELMTELSAESSGNDEQREEDGS